MSAAKIATAALPTESYPADFKQFFNGEGIHLIHIKNAHSDGDSIVHFRGSDVISAGDILSTVTYPVFDIAKGGSINGVIRGLNDLLDLAIAEYQTAVRSEPNAWQAHFNLGLAYAQMAGREADAIAEYQAALRMHVRNGGRRTRPRISTASGKR